MISLLASESIRTDEDSFARLFISIGCYFDIYSIPLLIAVVSLQISALGIRLKEISAQNPELPRGQKWKLAFGEDPSPNTLKQTPLATSNFLLVIFFISQLSFSLPGWFTAEILILRMPCPQSKKWEGIPLNLHNLTNCGNFLTQHFRCEMGWIHIRSE